MAIDTPTLAAMADELISAAKATPKISFFIVFLLHMLVSGFTDLSGIPDLPGESLPDIVSVPGDGLPFAAGTPNPLLETDVPERKNQNTQLVKYLFHFTSGRQGRFSGLPADLCIALIDSIICLGGSRDGS
ncbi:hypothetical protein [Mesorhizobium sp. M1396]|uniref:hypothetical protein n=1 Tax=Mesorhizobium sp. M1396 TaxID=2957095 RepID=UPI00333B379A